MVKTTIASVPPYLRSNKRYLAKYSAVYLFMWSAEWFWELPVEWFLLGGGALCLVVDFYINCIRTLNPTLVLRGLKKRALLKKKSFRRQKSTFVALSTFYTGVGRFLSNPSLRVAKTRAAALLNYIWLVAFIGAFLDFVLCPPLMVWLGAVPPTYSDHARFMELMVSGFFIDNGLDYTQSQFMNWLFSLAAFVFLISQTALLEGQGLSPYIRVAIKKLLATLTLLLLLEVLRVSALDFVLINQLNVHPIHAATTYVFLPSLWWVLYLRVFEYLSKKTKRSSTITFNTLADLNPRLGLGKNLAPLRLFIRDVPFAVAFATFCFFYLLVKTLCLFTLSPC